MAFRPDTLSLTIVLGLLTSIGPLSTDMYLPSLPRIMSELGADESGVQLTLSAFLFGFAAGQVVYGPISDKHGRRLILLASLVLFTLASLLCALSPTIEVLIAARALQAFGAAGSVVVARAVVRDLYDGPRAGQELAVMGTIMAVVPTIAPVFGAIIDAAFGWTMVFWAIAVSGIGLMILVVYGLPETLSAPTEEALSFRSVFKGFGTIIQVADFRFYVALVCLTYGGLFAYISASSFVFQIVYGYSQILFGFVFGLCALAFMAGTVLGRRVVARHGIDRTIAVGAVPLAIGGVTMMAGVAFGPGHGLEVLLPMLLYMVGVGFIMPHGTAGAMQPFRERAGAASSLLGILQMSSAALLGILVGSMLAIGDQPTAWPLAGTLGVTGCLALLLALYNKDRRPPETLSQTV